MAYKTGLKTHIFGGALIALLLAVLPISYIAGGAYTEAIPRPFDSKSWIAGEGMSDSRRCAMLADLKFRVGLEGKSRDEVVALLGRPQDQPHDPNTSQWLLCPSFMDIWVLAIRWERDRAVEATVHDT